MGSLFRVFTFEFVFCFVVFVIVRMCGWVCSLCCVVRLDGPVFYGLYFFVGL